MKKSFSNLLSILFPLLALGCSAEAEMIDDALTRDEGNTLELSVGVLESMSDITVIGSGQHQTRAAEKAAATTFEANDEVGVIVYEDVSGYKGNYRYKYNGAKWETVGMKYSIPTEVKDITYIVYSPYNSNVNASNASVKGLKDLINPDKTLSGGKYVQDTKALYHGCDLMVQTITQSSAVKTLFASQLRHQYSAFLIDFRQSVFVTLNNRDVIWPSELVGPSGGKYTVDQGFVTMTINGETKTFKPWLNLSSDGGDDHYRFIVAPSEGKSASFLWYQNYINTVKRLTPTTVLEPGNLYRCSGTVFVHEKTKKIEVGDIYCRDETDETGVVLPLEMFRYAKYETAKYCTKLKPIGIVFNVGTNTADNAAGYNRGYAISLKYAGTFAWGCDANKGNDIAEIKNIKLYDGETIPNEIKNIGTYVKADNVHAWTIDDFDGRHNCEVIKGLTGDVGKTVMSTKMKNEYPAFYYSLMFGSTATSTTGFTAPTNPLTPCSGWYFGSAAEMKFYYNNLGKISDTATQSDGNPNLRYVFDAGHYGYFNECVYWMDATVTKIQDEMNNHQAIIDAYMGTPTGKTNSWCQAFYHDDDLFTSSECYMYGNNPASVGMNVIGVGFLNRLNAWYGQNGRIALYGYGNNMCKKNAGWMIRPILAFGGDVGY